MKKIMYGVVGAFFLAVMPVSGFSDMTLKPSDPAADSNSLIPNAPAYYPKGFSKVGVFRQFHEGRALEISGIKYYYGINTPLHTVDSKFASFNNLTPGTVLGLKSFKDANGNLLLIEAWVIPPNVPIQADLDI